MYGFAGKVVVELPGRDRADVRRVLLQVDDDFRSRVRILTVKISKANSSPRSFPDPLTEELVRQAELERAFFGIALMHVPSSRNLMRKSESFDRHSDGLEDADESRTSRRLAMASCRGRNTLHGSAAEITASPCRKSSTVTHRLPRSQNGA